MRRSGLCVAVLLAASRAAVASGGAPQLIPELANPCELRQPDDPVAVEIAAFCKRFPDDLLKMMVTELHALGPALSQDQLDQGKDFHGFAIRSSAITGPRSDAGVLQRSLRSILTSRPTATPECFRPQHGVVLQGAGDVHIDVLVSFACNNYMVVSWSADWFYMGSFAVDERARWDAFFAKAGIAD